ncbi:MAG: glycosyltransferase family A protein [Thermoplasmata archaeon]
MTVIVPTLNSARTLKGAIESVVGQSYPFVETVLVDGGSDDATLTIAHGYPVEVAEGHWRRGAARLEGARRANGRYLLFLDSDQLLSKEIVAECVALCRDRGRSAVIIPEVSVGSGMWVQYHSLEKQLTSSTSGTGYPRFFERSVYFEIGGHSPEFDDFMEDRSIFLRFEGAGYRAATASNPITNDLGHFNLLEFGAKNARSTRDADQFYRANRDDSPFRVTLERARNLLDGIRRFGRDPTHLLLFATYLFVGYGPRLVLAAVGYF